MQALAENPARLIEQGAPHRIYDEEELDRYTTALFRLTELEEASPAEQATIDLLTFLIEDFESRYSLPQADPLSVLKYLMDKGGLRQQDLRPQLGSLSNISMILSGQRGLTLSNAYALAGRFNIDIRAFLSPKGRVGKKPTQAKIKAVSTHSAVDGQAKRPRAILAAK